MAVVVAVLGAMKPAGAQSIAAEAAMALLNNVVAIEATWQDGTVHDGFGFVAGKEGDEFYIATANHVLRGHNPDEIAERLELRVRQRAGRTYEGNLLDTHDPGFDIGVVVASLPADLEWRMDALAPQPEKLGFGTPVWFIGRSKEWYVPAAPGQVNSVDLLRHKIIIDDVEVREGTSGAPLVSEAGIVGMVVGATATDSATATLVAAIELLFRGWGLPWQLASVSKLPEPPGIPGVFRDCTQCPEMVVLPGGTFLMGSLPNEAGREQDEGPQHEVTIASFAIGKYEVTFAEWDECVAASGCRGLRPYDENWGRGQRPVINVTWEDAQEYVRWLRDQTGENYRLPSEAEWEYAARAGTVTPFQTGATITPRQANFDRSVGQTAEVGAYPPNQWGLYDMHGNVREWVEDCFHPGYKGAPDDSSPWVKTGDCKRRMIRGGSWENSENYIRSAYRYYAGMGESSRVVGFRVAKTLAPG